MQCSAANSISKIEQDIKFLKIYSLKVFQSHDNETVNKTMFLYLKKKKKTQQQKETKTILLVICCTHIHYSYGLFHI